MGTLQAEPAAGPTGELDAAASRVNGAATLSQRLLPRRSINWTFANWGHKPL